MAFQNAIGFFESLGAQPVTYNDWFLLSYNEGIKMFLNLHSGIDENSVVYTPVGGFDDQPYWTSHEDSALYATYQGFFGAGGQGSSLKDQVRNVRACRSFTSTTNYNLRDIGPAGGWVFWKSGNDYLEAAPASTQIITYWSNINIEIGAAAQGIVIGTGQANTTAIINQVGFIYGAAKFCNDLIVYH